MSNNGDLCLVIGPMGEGYIDRIKQLADKILAPLVSDLGYYVDIPDQAVSGNIMDQVIKLLDRAKLVVVDLTYNRPSVLYELGIVHSLGRPYITIREKKGGLDADQVPFDVRAYRYIEIEDFDCVEDAQEQVRPYLENVHQEIAENRLVPNPVTAFYGAPLTRVQSSERLAHGYYVNFIRPLVEIINSDQRLIQFDGADIEQDRIAQVKLEILMPCRITQAFRPNIRYFLRASGLKEYLVKSEARSFTVYARPEMSAELHLVDIPTPLYSMKDYIENRLGPGTYLREDPSRIELERIEIERFTNEIKWLIEQDELMIVRDVVQIVGWDAALETG